MVYRIAHTPAAEDEYLSLPLHVQSRVARWYDLLKEDPRRAKTKRLEGHPELRRVHAGHDYVVLYTIRENERLILVVRVAHRREAYRHLPKL